MTYRLYWTRHSGALGPHILLEEAGLPYEIVPIDFRAGENHKPEYLKISPMGYLPALEAEDGEVIYETAAIMLHLAEKHQLEEHAPALTDPQRGAFLKHLFFLCASVQYCFHILYNPQRYCGLGNSTDAAKAQASELIFDRWKHIDDALQADGPYLLGNRYSLLDIYTLMMATWVDPLDRLLDSYPAYKRCHELTASRPAVRKILQEHELV
jgi:glutathione S-transferase